MRLLGILVIAAMMYFAVPLLWQRTIVHKVQSAQASQALLPPEPEIDKQIDSVDPSNMAMNIPPPVEIDTKKYEAIALQSQTDEAIRRSQQMQDQAEHGYDPGRN